MIKRAEYKSNDYCANSELAYNENNDCVVRAIASSFEISYDEAHALAKKMFRRQDKRGTMAVSLIMEREKVIANKIAKQMGFLCPEEFEEKRWYGFQMKWSWKDKGELKYATYTTGRFIENFPQGTYFMITRGHCFTIIDGVVHGNKSDAIYLKVRIQNAFKITNIQRP